jgi:hypothetical protein
MSIRKESLMEREESGSAPPSQSDHFVPTDDGPTVAVAISVREAEPKGPSFSPSDAIGRGTQVWDNPWVDLGGEG